MQLGQNVHITGGSFVDAMNEGVRQGYQQGFLRSSIVHTALERINTGDKTPAIVNTEIVPGDRRKIGLLMAEIFMKKGATDTAGHRRASTKYSVWNQFYFVEENLVLWARSETIGYAVNIRPGMME